MSEIPDDVLKAAVAAVLSADIGIPRTNAAIHFAARSILAERKRCADWCEKTAFIGYAKDRILSGEQP